MDGNHGPERVIEVKKQEFEHLKEQTRKDIDAICKEYPDTAVYVVISQITVRAGLPGERNFSESQLKELFDLAEEHTNAPVSGNSTEAQNK